MLEKVDFYFIIYFFFLLIYLFIYYRNHDTIISVFFDESKSNIY